MSDCRSCQAPVLWVQAVKKDGNLGAKMPVDADPDRPGLAWRVPPAGVCAPCRGKGHVERPATAAEREHAVVECAPCQGTGKLPLGEGQELGRAVDGHGLGSLIFTKQRTAEGLPIVRYVKAGPFLIRSHFVSCLQAKQHRRTP